MSNKKDQLPNKVDFLKHYNIPEKEFEQANIKWEILQGIYSDYASNIKNLEATGTSMMGLLRYINEVHSLKMRIKDPEHLIEKIIRKRIKDPKREFTLENYQEQITDLIGIRALHLFKDEWKPIHDKIMDTWALQEKPKAYVREGDSKELQESFVDNGLEVAFHENGYRSLHYILKCQPTKHLVFVELQVRTLFEEGWSEIDHQIRYPYFKDDLLLSRYLDPFNRLAGSADEMGSFIKILKNFITDRTEMEAALKVALSEKETAVKDVKNMIAKLEITKAEKAKLEEKVEKLSPQKSIFTQPPPGFTLADIYNRVQSGTALPSGEVFHSKIISRDKCVSCGEEYNTDSLTSILSNKCPKCHVLPK